MNSCSLHFQLIGGRPSEEEVSLHGGTAFIDDLFPGWSFYMRPEDTEERDLACLGKPLSCSEPPSLTLSWAGLDLLSGSSGGLTGCHSQFSDSLLGQAKSSYLLSRQHTAIPGFSREVTHQKPQPIPERDSSESGRHRGPNHHFQLRVPSCLIPQTQVPHLLCQ